MRGFEKKGRTQLLLFLTALLRGSLFCRLATRLADFLFKKVRASQLAGFLTAYPEAAVQDSYFGELLFERPAGLFKQFRLWLAAQTESCLLARLAQGMTRGMLSLDMVSWAGGLLSLGSTLLLVETWRRFKGLIPSMLTPNAGFAVACLLSGLLCANLRVALGEMLLDSRPFRWLLVDFCGVRSSTLSVKRPVQWVAIPVVLGTLLALLSVRLPLFWLLGGLAALIGAGILISIPETGVLLILLALPFLGTLPLALLCLYVDGAYLFKWLRLKRVMRIEAIDFGVLGFAVTLLLLGGLTSIRRGASLPQVAIYLVFILTYFTAANIICSKRLADRAVACLLCSGAVAALMGVYQNIVGIESSVSWIDTKMFAEIGARVVGPFDNPNVFGEYLIMLLPLGVCAAAIYRGGRRAAALATTGAVGLALIYTWSRGAWLGAIAAVALFLLLYHRIFLNLVLPGLVALPFAVALLPDAILGRLTSIGNLADTSTAYRVSIWNASVRMLGDVAGPGIGSGWQAFTALYPVYALGGAAYALHAHNLYLQLFIELGVVGIATFAVMLVLFFKWVFHCYEHILDRNYASIILALGMGVLALLVQGLTDNVWFNYRIVLLFWLLMGLAVGIGRSGTLDRI
ncbi:MAG: hypothetical protein GXX99_01835 [Clostridiales bacterium]|nr:hypothetical protein [Clostridiales bacterium]